MHVTIVNKKNKRFATLSLGILVLAITGFFIYRHFFHIPNLARNPEALAVLQSHWKKGDVVVLIRHAERCDRSLNPCVLADGRGVTVVGKRNAIKLGQYFKQLLTLDNARIYNSPSIRTTQTRQFIFGDRGTKQKWLEDCKADLLKTIFKSKVPQQNLILVTHSTCLKALRDTNNTKLVDIKVTGDKAYGFTAFIKVVPRFEETLPIGYLYFKDWKAIMPSQ